VYRVLVGKPEGKKPQGRPKRRCEDNVKMDLMDWIVLTQDRDRLWLLVIAVMNVRFPKKCGEFLD
jgi:hypothetical protein